MRACSVFVLLALAACAPSSEEDVGEGGAAVSTASAAAKILYLDARPPTQCASGTDDERIRCLVSARYAADPTARDLALDFWSTTRGVPGLLPRETYDGGYRGVIELVPELPVNGYRKHLVWVRDAMRDIDGFFGGVTRAASSPVHYRWRQIDFRFFRSVGRTTPSASTEGTWEVQYNVVGSLNSSVDAVRETLFHELFHVNDWTHDDWSPKALGPIVDGIVARCGTRTACLAPYTPTKTIVKGGTYYAFQPNNGEMVVEYAAELATRYFAEQSAAMASTPSNEPAFKCGPSENRRAWDLLRNEFFGGVDLTPPCP